MKKKKAVKAPLGGFKLPVSPLAAVLIAALVATVVLQTLALSVTASYIGALQTGQNRSREDIFKALVTSSVHGVYEQGVIDAAQERVYIPELRIHVPLNTTTRHLVYSYLPGSNGTQDFAIISLRQVAQRRISDISSLSCNRMVRVIFAAEQPGTDEEAPLTKLLKDGRTAYIFKSRNACSNIYTDTEISELLNGMLAAESY